jgi:hypothetical protein
MELMRMRTEGDFVDLVLDFVIDPVVINSSLNTPPSIRKA